MRRMSALDSGARLRRMNDVNNAIDAWLGDLARAGRTKATRNKYQWWLWHFASYLEGQGVRDCDRILPDHCRGFLDRWIDKPDSMAAGVTVLTKWCAWLADETVIEPPGPAHRLQRPRRKRPEELDVVTVSSTDVERLFAATDGWQELLCIALLAYMGPRRSAASRARRRDVDLERGTIRFREKGGKVILKPLPDELTAILRAASTSGVWASDDDYLIPNRREQTGQGERSAKVIYDTVKKVAARAGVKSHVHALRAAFAVRMDEQYPGRLVAVKELLGHARVETTMVYLRRQDKAREMETVRGLSWGSVFPTNPALPPAGFEPALPDNQHHDTGGAVTDGGSLPAVLLAKLESMRIAGNA